jgi:hypothetical protein
MVVGLLLGNDKNAIWITKGEAKIVFDLKIPTKSAFLFAAYITCHTEVAGTNVSACSNGGS